MSGFFMNKILLLLFTVLGFQYFAADVMAGGAEKKEKEREVVLTARFIEAADLEDSSPIIDAVKEYVGATDDADKWAGAKATITGQIKDGVIRRVLFFVGERLVDSASAGRMPLAIFPAAEKDSSISFTNGQESIASVYKELAGAGAVELFEKGEKDGEGTWSLTRDGAKIFAATLLPNAQRDPSIIVAMHLATYGLFMKTRAPIRLPDSSMVIPRLYVSMVTPIDGLSAADFGKDLGLQVGRLYKGDETLIHNYFPGRGDAGLYLMLAGPINQ